MIKLNFQNLSLTAFTGALEAAVDPLEVALLCIINANKHSEKPLDSSIHINHQQMSDYNTYNALSFMWTHAKIQADKR